MKNKLHDYFQPASEVYKAFRSRFYWRAESAKGARLQRKSTLRISRKQPCYLPSLSWERNTPQSSPAPTSLLPFPNHLFFVPSDSHYLHSYCHSWMWSDLQLSGNVSITDLPLFSFKHVFTVPHVTWIF